ncbi:MAG: sensor histidine kinase [Lachnospiraceae bacterium]
MNFRETIKTLFYSVIGQLKKKGILDSGEFHSPVAAGIWKRTLNRLKIYTGICMVFLFVILQMKDLLQQHYWQGNNPYYTLLHFLDQWRYRIPLAIYVLGIIIIIFQAFRKSIHYLDSALQASEKIADDSDELIELPGDFKEIETQLNAVKLEVQNNARAAKEAEQRKNDLVVYLAHDLKTPLTSVIGYLNLLTETTELSRDMQQKYLGIALKKAERLEDLINEFFEITRFNLTHITLELGNINMTRLLEQLVYEFSPMLAEKRLTCSLKAPADVQFCCDGDKMQRVFDNLLRNAVNYSHPDTEITIAMEKEEKGLHITFLNYGNTIPKDKLDRLFEQFFRLDSSRGSGSGGAGLGLAIAKEIVELHKGTIRASSSSGTIVFEIFLPD